VGKTEIKDSEFIHPINSDKKDKQFLLLKEKIKHFEFDLIIANNLRTHFLLSNLNLKNDLYVFHQGSLLQKKSFFTSLKQKIKFKKVYNKKRVVFLNECFKNEFLHKFKIDLDYKIIPNPFDFEKIRKKAVEFEVEGDYILGVGRLTKDKNFEFLLKAYALGNFKQELWILGDGKEKEKLRNLTKKLNIADRVKFLGWRSNPYPYIKRASLLVHPSKKESFGNVLVEGLVLNTPVIATDIKCGPGEILTGELKEFLVPLTDSKFLCDKMQLALNNYPQIKEEYIEKFKLENVAKKYLEFLH
jgi:glycosyltransferase involved in cell wall biosynthesis